MTKILNASKQQLSPAPAAPHHGLVLVGIRVAIGAMIVMAVVLALWWARTAVLLLFAGILLAVLLHGISTALAKWTGLPRSAMLAAVLLATTLFLVGVGSTAGPVLATEVTELGKSLATTMSQLGQWAANAATDQGLNASFKWTDVLGQLPSPLGIATGATAVATATFGVVSSLLIVLFFGIYFAIDPTTYTKLLVRLAPPHRREQSAIILAEISVVLHRWLIGQVVAMAVVGTAAYIGLLLLGVPLAIVLALFLGLMEFIPYIGPIMGAVPMLLIAAGQSFHLFVWVAGLYLVIQLLESYVLTPLIQARAVSLPPAVAILNQLIFGAVFGILGLALATPLAAAAWVPIKRGLEQRNLEAEKT